MANDGSMTLIFYQVKPTMVEWLSLVRSYGQQFQISLIGYKVWPTMIEWLSLATRYGQRYSNISQWLQGMANDDRMTLIGYKL